MLQSVKNFVMTLMRATAVAFTGSMIPRASAAAAAAASTSAASTSDISRVLSSLFGSSLFIGPPNCI